MAEKRYRVTVDTESDFGGRTEALTGIRDGVPKLLELFRAYKVKALWFISTEIIKECRYEVSEIKNQGHGIGSHGHFHIVHNQKKRLQQDKEISFEILKAYCNLQTIPYRPPKFQVKEDYYSDPSQWSSLLRLTWGVARRKNGLYIHPFDIAGSRDNPPNLFTRIWYSNPDKAWKNLTKMIDYYV